MCIINSIMQERKFYVRFYLLNDLNYKTIFISYHSFLTAALHLVYLTACALTLHFLNEFANDAESTQKIDHDLILASLKSKSTW